MSSIGSIGSEANSVSSYEQSPKDVLKKGVISKEVFGFKRRKIIGRSKSEYKAAGDNGIEDFKLNRQPDLSD